jgi:hypothetical protein
MNGAYVRSSHYGAGERTGVPCIRAFARRRRLPEPFQHRFRVNAARETPAGRICRLIGVVGGGNLLSKMQMGNPR